MDDSLDFEEESENAESLEFGEEMKGLSVLRPRRRYSYKTLQSLPWTMKKDVDDEESEEEFSINDEDLENTTKRNWNQRRRQSAKQ